MSTLRKLMVVAGALLMATQIIGCTNRQFIAAGAYMPFAGPEPLTLNEPYMLDSGDRLRIVVFGQSTLSRVYSVDGGGHISMPLIGPVQARGLTTFDLEHAISERLRDGYLRDPKISVEIQTYRPFFILGEVTRAGQYSFVNAMTVQTAVAIAGGFSARAHQGGAIITRQRNGQAMQMAVPMTQTVKPGDTIYVRERLF